MVEQNSDLDWGVYRRILVVMGGLIIIGSAIDAVGMAWGDRRPVGAFFEAFVAQGLYYGGFLVSLGAAIWGGLKIFNETNSRWLGWISGIALFLMIDLGLFTLSLAIPGVGWRIEKLMTVDEN